jgi:hypothetical protein
MLSKKEFIQKVRTDASESCLLYEDLRWGQVIFNSVEELFGSEIARTSQFIYNIDCFYDDNKVNDFLEKCYELYVINQRKPIDFQKVLNWWKSPHDEDTRKELIKEIESE